jgi:tRNA G18 (ribose-2'-O)-methylase SpoU
VLLDPTTADPLYRRSVRVSLGHVLRVPWTRVTPWPAAVRILADQGFAVLALTPAADAEPIGRVADALGRAAPRGTDGRRRVALVVGAEGQGLTEEAMADPARRVRIPLAPGVDSLNVATAAAVALHAVAGDRLR